MKYALIGCGRISTNHIKAAVADNLEIVAVCDIVPERMTEVLSKHGLENNKSIARYTDYKGMRQACRDRVVLYRARHQCYYREAHGDVDRRRR